MLPEAADAKQTGNACMKKGDYIEAMLHYTKAIKLEPTDAPLYSNRSFAFLKMQQLYHAHEDACSAIRLMPSWTKGYFRKGEAESEAQHYKEAIQSYNKGLSIDPGEPGLQKALSTATQALQKQQYEDRILPLYGVGIGLTLGTGCVLADQFLTQTPSIQYDILKVLLVLVFCGIFYALALAYRSFMQNQRASLLDPPLDLFQDGDSDTTQKSDCKSKAKGPHNKSAGRRRMNAARS